MNVLVTLDGYLGHIGGYSGLTNCGFEHNYFCPHPPKASSITSPAVRL
jgi:hypothetical protein